MTASSSSSPHPHPPPPPPHPPHPHAHPPPTSQPIRTTSAMATTSQQAAADTTQKPHRRNSIANLLLPQQQQHLQPQPQPQQHQPTPPPQSQPPPTDPPEKNLLSLSHLAATMTPAMPPANRHQTARPPTRQPTRHQPAKTPSRHASTNRRAKTDTSTNRATPTLQTTLPDDTRRTLPQSNRLPRPSSLAGPSLGVSRTASKRIARSKSGLTTPSARKSVMCAVNTPPHASTPTHPSANVLRPINCNPPVNPATVLPTKHSTASNSPPPPPRSFQPVQHHHFHPAVSTNTVSTAAVTPRPQHADPPRRPAPSRTPFNPDKSVFLTAARGLAAAAATSQRDHDGLHDGLRDDGMDVVDDVHEAADLLEQLEPSSSSHDAKALPARGKTTPDAKRAQNRESAKRFRVAQKKRWAELNETVAEKEEEIVRLKTLLQEVTNRTVSSMAVPVPAGRDCSPVVRADALALAELELFVKLLSAQEGEGDGGRNEGGKCVPLGSDLGSLHRVIVSKLNGSVLGVRHECVRNGAVMGGDVGGCLWEFVHASDCAHLRASVVHAKTMLQVMNGQPCVFSYRRREKKAGGDDMKDGEDDGGDRAKRKDCYIRMKGCLYPIVDDDGNVNNVILAEFIEL